ncbi:hypothetical protein MHH81_01000 [Psychrobacillus sp. FSL H8-0484]
MEDIKLTECFTTKGVSLFPSSTKAAGWLKKEIMNGLEKSFVNEEES